jgi:hypothetical protein
MTKKEGRMTARIDRKTLIEVLKAKDGKVYNAAAALGCSATAIYRHINRDPEIAEIVQQARGELVDLAEDALKQAVRRGEGWAVCFTLKTQGRDRGYIENPVNVQGPIKIEVVEVPNPKVTKAEHAAAKELLGVQDD